jgi:hypothetical protein
VYLLTYLFTYPWNRVLLQKLTGFEASQEIPCIYGTPKFITVLTSARHLSLSWARSIQSPQTPPTSSRSILILSSHLRLGLLPSGFPTKTVCLLVRLICFVPFNFYFEKCKCTLKIWGGHPHAPTPKLEDHSTSPFLATNSKPFRHWWSHHQPSYCRRLGFGVHSCTYVLRPPNID